MYIYLYTFFVYYLRGLWRKLSAKNGKYKLGVEKVFREILSTMQSQYHLLRQDARAPRRWMGRPVNRW